MKTPGLFLLLALALLASACSRGPDCANPPAGETCLQILFIGNSYTFVNDLPATFAKLAQSGGHAVQVEMAAQGGWTLADHLAAPETSAKISAQKWDYVVLQEQSQMPAESYWRVKTMYPAAEALVQKIRANGSQPLFFNTWAHKNGWPENNIPDYTNMQNQINYGYLEIAQKLDVPLALAGYAWAEVYAQHPEIALWQEDGSHPSEKGTYLAACVFYAVIYRQSPLGLDFGSSLNAGEAEILQKAAAFTVLGR